MTSGAGESGEPPRVFVVEDQFILADLMSDEIEKIGWEVVGPVGSVSGALRLIDQDVAVALLDINLGTELVTPVADELVQRSIPFGFLTAYADSKVLPYRFSDAPFFKKPLSGGELATALERLLP